MAISSDEVMAAIPRGIILPWYSNSNAVPRGWHLCDGANGTPDLRGRFLRGGDATEAMSAGGSENHQHKVAKDGGRDGRGFNVEGTCGLGDTDSRSHVPPFVTVQYIIKL